MNDKTKRLPEKEALCVVKAMNLPADIKNLRVEQDANGDVYVYGDYGPLVPTQHFGMGGDPIRKSWWQK